MAKKAKKIDYIQLESRAFPEDFEWLSMSPVDRGIYHSLLIFLACNEGSLPSNESRLGHLCNCNMIEFRSFWETYKHKFITKDECISHKRVTEEIKNARKAFKKKSLAGQAGVIAKEVKRKQRLSDAASNEQAKKRKVKEKKEKKKETYLLNLNLSSASFYSWMESEFKITTKRERGTFTKYAKLYAGLCSLDKSFNLRMNDKLLDMKKDALGDKEVLNKMFIASINNEIEKLEIPK